MKNHLFSIKFFLLFVFIVVVGAAPAFAKPGEAVRKLKRIELLKSTKAEVEKLFGNPQVVETRDLTVELRNGWGKDLKYETKYGILEIEYATGKCAESKGRLYAYDIAADIVLGIRFYPNEIVLENQLGYDLGKFQNDSESDTYKKYSFETEKLKIGIAVDTFQVASIEYDIAESYKTRFECQNAKVKEPVWFEKLRTLELFKSTRSEVEALFDNPRISEIDDTVEDGDDWSVDVEYETNYGKLEVRYSTGKCIERQSKYGYNAARDTLADLEFTPSEKNDATELNFDFRKLESASSPSGIIKKVPELSLSIFLDRAKIEWIRISPNDKQEGEFDCDEIWSSQK